MQNRTSLLESLIEYRSSTEELQHKLKTYGWDSEEELVTLTAQHIVSVLARFLNGNLGAQAVEDWADAIEGREDIAMSDAIIEAIHHLANPTLTDPLDQQEAEKLIAQLS